MMTLEKIKKDIDIETLRLANSVDASGVSSHFVSKKRNDYSFDFEKKAFQISDFVDLPPKLFVEYAYRALLKRYPDQSGKKHYEQQLLEGYSRASILFRIFFNQERRKKGVRLRKWYVGAWDYFISQLPILSRSSKKANRRFEQALNIVDAQQSTIRELQKYCGQITTAIRDISDQMQILAKDLISFDTRQQDRDHEILELKSTLNAEFEKMKQNDFSVKSDLSKIQRNIEIIQKGYQTEDAFYEAFESKFRGDEEIIKDRLKVYLPYVDDHFVVKNAGKALDIGCGRGEWLDLLISRYSIDIVGVDNNQKFADGATSHIIHADYFDWHTHQSPESYDLITSFHLIEHLKPNELLQFIQSIHRLLKPGGLLILESPSPISLQTSASNFYLDLTHRKPVHPATLRFSLEYYGFNHIETLYLQPHLVYENFLKVKPDPNLEILMKDVYGYQDYGIVVMKS